MKKLSFNLTPAQLGRRVIVYCAGLFIMALGVSFSVKGNLGVSPVNSIAYEISAVLQDATGKDMLITRMGTWTTLTFWFYLLLQFIILRREFSPVRLLQLLSSFLNGWFINITNRICSVVLPDPAAIIASPAGAYGMRLVYLLISMALVGLGIFLYVSPTELPPLPGEGLMLVISGKKGVPLHRVKIAFDCIVAGSALVISLSYFRYLNGVREGTVIAAVGVGVFLGIFRKRLSSAVNKFMG